MNSTAAHLQRRARHLRGQYAESYRVAFVREIRLLVLSKQFISCINDKIPSWCLSRIGEMNSEGQLLIYLWPCAINRGNTNPCTLIDHQGRIGGIGGTLGSVGADPRSFCGLSSHAGHVKVDKIGYSARDKEPTRKPSESLVIDYLKPFVLLIPFSVLLILAFKLLYPALDEQGLAIAFEFSGSVFALVLAHVPGYLLFVRLVERSK
jgi:hypothetical protein